MAVLFFGGEERAVLVPVTSLVMPLPEAYVIFNCRTDSTGWGFKNAAIDVRQLLPPSSSQPLDPSPPLCRQQLSHSHTQPIRLFSGWSSLTRVAGQEDKCWFWHKADKRTMLLGTQEKWDHLCRYKPPSKAMSSNWTWNCRCRWDGSTVLCESNASFKVFLIILSHAWKQSYYGIKNYLL